MAGSMSHFHHYFNILGGFSCFFEWIASGQANAGNWKNPTEKFMFAMAMEFSDRLPKINIEKLDSLLSTELVNRFFDTISLTQKELRKYY